MFSDFFLGTDWSPYRTVTKRHGALSVLLLACREHVGGFLLHLLLPASRNVADVAQRAHFGLNFKLQLLVFDLNVSTT